MIVKNCASWVSHSSVKVPIEVVYGRPVVRGHPPRESENTDLNPPDGDDLTDEEDWRVLNRPYKCAVIGCGKRYKNSNGIKYHNLHGHKNDTLITHDDGSVSLSTDITTIKRIVMFKPYVCPLCVIPKASWFTRKPSIEPPPFDEDIRPPQIFPPQYNSIPGVTNYSERYEEYMHAKESSSGDGESESTLSGSSSTAETDSTNSGNNDLLASESIVDSNMNNEVPIPVGTSEEGRPIFSH
ncbi:hypothetical protein FF38_12188, partial [Lucilia cuprina]